MNLEQTQEFKEILSSRPLENQPDRTYGDILDDSQLALWGQHMFNPQGSADYFKNIGQEQLYAKKLEKIKNNINFYDRLPVQKEKTLTRFEEFIGKDLGFGELALADRIYILEMLQKLPMKDQDRG